MSSLAHPSPSGAKYQSITRYVQHSGARHHSVFSYLALLRLLFVIRTRALSLSGDSRSCPASWLKGCAGASLSTCRTAAPLHQCLAFLTFQPDEQDRGLSDPFPYFGGKNPLTPRHRHRFEQPGIHLGNLGLQAPQKRAIAPPFSASQESSANPPGPKSSINGTANQLCRTPDPRGKTPSAWKPITSFSIDTSLIIGRGPVP